ncbi:unnamed protein product [Cylindrotheca closterium]|uniref:Uncharacterized protein n=1 Tax=Cylindrotheca closterium TaxID=2856 RepID=A0AAD2JLL6_9STRA|nr:unnamed protein product [Cylindrotheca closterium]
MYSIQQQKSLPDTPPDDVESLIDSFQKHVMLNRFSDSSERGVRGSCPMPQRYASVDNFDISSRSEGTGTTTESGIGNAAIASVEDQLPHSKSVYRRRGSNLCLVEEQNPLSDVPPEDVEGLMNPFEEHVTLNRFSGSSERAVTNLCPMPQRYASVDDFDIPLRSEGFGNPCPMPQRYASVDDFDISSRSEGTATTTASCYVDFDEFNSSTFSTITIEEEDFVPSSRPIRQRRGSNLCSVEELKALSDHPSENVARLLDSPGERTEAHRNQNRFSGNSQGSPGNACPMPQRFASIADLDISSRSGGTASKSSELPKQQRTLESQDGQLCPMPRPQPSVGHWETHLNYQRTQQTCPMPQRKSSTNIFDFHDEFQQSYQSTFFLKEETPFGTIDSDDRAKSEEDTQPVWSPKMHDAVRKYEARKTDKDSGDVLGYGQTSRSLDLIDIFGSD